MDRNSENLQNLQFPLVRSLDEMSQQTLDALKVVHSFESKPARSERIRQMLEQKASKAGERLPLQPLKSARPMSSPERGVYGLSKTAKTNSKPGIPTMTDSYLVDKIMEEDIYNGIERKSQREAGAKQRSAENSMFSKPSLGGSSLFRQSSSAVTKQINRGLAKPSLGSSALPALRTKVPSAAFPTSSRLLQPTAASVAKINTRFLPRPASKGVVKNPKSVTAQSGIDSGNPVLKLKATLKPPSDPSSLSSNNLIGKSKVPILKPQHTVSASDRSQEVPAATTTPLSKTVTEQQLFRQIAPNDGPTINPSLLTLSSINNNPAKTSTPVRPLVPLTEGDGSTMHSIDYSNFSNFSYVADWAKTPELAKKALDQQHVDTLRLFGTIPPVDIEAIFGAEIKRQQRHQ